MLKERGDVRGVPDLPRRQSQVYGHPVVGVGTERVFRFVVVCSGQELGEVVGGLCEVVDTVSVPEVVVGRLHLYQHR